MIFTYIFKVYIFNNSVLLKYDIIIKPIFLKAGVSLSSYFYDLLISWQTE